MDPYLAIILYLTVQAREAVRRYPCLAGEEDDLVQEALLRAVGAGLNLGTHALAQAICFCRQALYWVVRTRLRERGRPIPSSQLQATDEETSPLNLAVDGGPSPDVVVEQQEWFAVMLGRLDARHGTALRLHLDGRTYEEIAETLGSSVSTAHRLVAEAIEQLREGLPDDPGSPS